MYKILLADDEGIMLDSLKMIIEKNFGNSCEIRSVKTGRAAIEVSEEFRPDIAFMDIQMPGINGIEAMKEMRGRNQNLIFIVMTAYDKFTFAKEAINLGVLDYLTKPANQTRIVETLERAMRRVDEEREKRSEDLVIKEKLEIVVPIIESGFIYTILLRENYSEGLQSFRQLLEIQEDYGFIVVMQFGDEKKRGNLTNPVGAAVKAQGFYPELREIAKEFFDCVIGPIMANKIVLFVPWRNAEIDYEERILIIEKARNMVRKLMKRIEVQFQVGIGAVYGLNELFLSYREAIKAMQLNESRVIHVDDLPIVGEYDGDYPAELEKELFHNIEKADTAAAVRTANRFFDWMVEKFSDCQSDIQVKVLEFVIRAEYIAFRNGGMNYGFHYRNDYLQKVMEVKDYSELHDWFTVKITDACQNVESKKEEQTNDIVSKAKFYITDHYNKDISLDDVSRSVNISPYYFSKLFKDETGENFIEFLTNIRMEKAKELLNHSDYSIKEICILVGYSDPNYFSRIFKKNMGNTPTEYREGGRL